MSQEQDFLKTITLLMRLTRNGKLQWQEKDVSEQPFAHDDVLPVYEAQLNSLRFRLEDAGGSSVVPDLGEVMAGSYTPPGKQYRLIVLDSDDSSRISSPPLKAANDLVAVIQSKDQRKIDDINRRLEEINRRLESAE